MEISLSDLRKVTNKIFDHLERLGYQKLELDKDYYWNISEELVYDVSIDPTDFEIGQLSDDWAELEKILSNEDKPLSYSLVWLSAILRFVGETVVK